MSSWRTALNGIPAMQTLRIQSGPVPRTVAWQVLLLGLGWEPEQELGLEMRVGHLWAADLAE